jgi:hypothetical protein
MRFLFVFNTPGFLRYFDTTLERLLAGGHEVVLTFQRPDLRPESLEILELENPRLRIVEQAPTRKDDYAELAETVRVCADYVRYLDPRFVELEYLRSRMRTRALRVSPLMHRFANRTSINGPLARATLRFLLACERAIPSAGNIETFISEIAPDAVLVSPLVTSASPQTDYIKSAQRLGIPAGLLVASWDNLTNKGLMRVVPDKVFVWNDTQRTEAVKFHRVPRRRVVLTGAQPFDRWFGREPRETRAEFCTKVGLDPNRPYAIFVGSSSNIARQNVEETFVRKWIEALRASEDTLVRELGVLVRPHPDRRGDWGQVDLEGLKNATLWPPERPNSVAPDARADYFDSLYHSAAVVGINTSAMIEGAIIGHPVLTIRAPEFVEAQRGTIHFHYLLPENGGFLIVGGDFREHARQLARAIRKPAMASELNNRFLSSFIRPHGLDQACTEILAGQLEGFATAGRRKARLRPTSYPLRALLAFNLWRSKRRLGNERSKASVDRAKERADRMRRRGERMRRFLPGYERRLRRKADRLIARAKEQRKRVLEQEKAHEAQRAQAAKEAKQRGRELLEQGTADERTKEQLNV